MADYDSYHFADVWGCGDAEVGARPTGVVAGSIPAHSLAFPPQASKRVWAFFESDDFKNIKWVLFPLYATHSRSHAPRPLPQAPAWRA